VTIQDLVHVNSMNTGLLRPSCLAACSLYFGTEQRNNIVKLKERRETKITCTLPIYYNQGEIGFGGDKTAMRRCAFTLRRAAPTIKTVTRVEGVALEGLDIQDRLQYARAAVAVLRALKITGSTMRYGDLARAIGLIPDGGRWEAWHRQEVADILQLVAAVERQGTGKEGAEPLEFERIVPPRSGRPARESEITAE
jgi:hypothetical protein